MVIHVLPGDSLTETFGQTGIDGEVVVCRECLVDGPVNAPFQDDFWQMRARFLTPENPAEYLEKTVPEFDRLIASGRGDEVNLWFEYELFCQVNMWFCLALLENTGAEVYRIAPVPLSPEKKWDGFARSTAEELKTCFSSRTKVSAEDISMGAELWKAFRTDDLESLRRLSNHHSESFPYLEEVCEAAIQKDIEPRRLLTDILVSGETDFSKIFVEFRTHAGVYGYGDDQVKRLLESL